MTLPWSTGLIDQSAAQTVKSATVTIKTNLLAYWEMEEATGTRFDSHTTHNDLIDFNGVGQTTGVVGNAANIQSDLFGLYIPSPPFGFSGGMTLVFWLKFVTSIPGLGVTIVRKFGSVDVDREFRLTFNGGVDNQFYLSTFDGAGGVSSVQATTFGTPAANAWNFYACTANNLNLKFSVNAGTQDSATQSAPMPNGSDYFAYGSQGTYPNPMAFDQCGVWNRALTTTEISFLYNGGSGRAYSALP